MTEGELKMENERSYFETAVTIRNYTRAELWDMLTRISEHKWAPFNGHEIDAELNRRDDLALYRRQNP